MRAIVWWSSFGTGDAVTTWTRRSDSSRVRCGRFETPESRGSSSAATGVKPSKPLDCRNKAMSQENVEVVRQPLQLRERSSRTLDQRLAMRFPRLYAVQARLL